MTFAEKLEEISLDDKQKAQILALVYQSYLCARAHEHAEMNFKYKVPFYMPDFEHFRKDIRQMVLPGDYAYEGQEPFIKELLKA